MVDDRIESPNGADTILPVAAPQGGLRHGGAVVVMVVAVALGVLVVGAGDRASVGARGQDRPDGLRHHLVDPADETELAPVSAPPRSDAPPLGDVVTRSVASLDRFWESEIERLYAVESDGGPALAPYLPSTGTVPPCGDDLDAAMALRQAFYCSLGDYIAWDAEVLLPEAYTFFHPLAPGVILAHEWAHSIQQRADVASIPLNIELQADCFAGAWLAAVDDPELARLRSGFLDRAPRFFAWIGDPHDGAVGESERHGHAGERLAAFREGYSVDGAACVLFESGPPGGEAG